MAENVLLLGNYADQEKATTVDSRNSENYFQDKMCLLILLIANLI